jgi:photosystem II stability/assembly factor-like uncharacterized protein
MSNLIIIKEDNAMSMIFSDLVEEVRHRPVEEKTELEHLLKHDLTEARRQDIHENHLLAVEEVKSGKRIPTSDVDEFMRRLTLIVLAILLVMQSNICRAQWVRTNGPNGATVNCIAVSKGVLAAGTHSGLYYSLDTGSTWILSNDELSDYMYVTSLALDDSTLFAGVLGGVFESDDGGATWTYDSRGVLYSYFWNLSANGDLLYAGTGGGGIYRSTNRGATWDSVNNGLPANSYIQAIAFLGSRTFANAYGGTYISDDSGTNWSMTKSPGAPYGVNTFLVVESTLWAGGYGGLFRSHDTGSSWQKILISPFPNISVAAIAVLDNNIFVGTDTGVFLSTNNGMDWTLANTGLPPSFHVNSFALIGTNLFAGTTDSCIWRRPLSDFGISTVAQTPSTPPQIQSYPNPFTQSTTIAFSSQDEGYADVTVVNLLGSQVARIFSGELAAGEHSFTWDANGMAPGMYECIVRMNGQAQRISMILSEP